MDKLVAPSKYEFIKDLCEGNSLQSKVTNRIWVALLLISANAFFTEVDLKTDSVTLMFSLNTVKPFYHFIFNFFAIGLLSIAFASAHCQAIISRQLIENAMGNEAELEIHGVKLRSFVDSIINPTFQRVGPIFIAAKTGESNDGFKNLDSFLYIILKAITLALFYFLPAYILIDFGVEIIKYDGGWYALAVCAMWVASIVSTIRALYLDLTSILRVVAFQRRRA
jgi:hypothetical protein